MTPSQFDEQNKRDISMGIRMLMAKGVEGRAISQSLLSEFSGLGNDIISKILNPGKNSTYSPTSRTLSRVFAVWQMTAVDFYKFVLDNTPRL